MREETRRCWQESNPLALLRPSFRSFLLVPARSRSFLLVPARSFSQGRIPTCPELRPRRLTFNYANQPSHAIRVIAWKLDRRAGNSSHAGNPRGIYPVDTATITRNDPECCERGKETRSDDAERKTRIESRSGRVSASGCNSANAFRFPVGRTRPNYPREIPSSPSSAASAAGHAPCVTNDAPFLRLAESENDPAASAPAWGAPFYGHPRAFPLRDCHRGGTGGDNFISAAEPR